MRTARKIIGIISVMLFFLISFQSCAAGTYNALADTGEHSGTAGMTLAFCMAIAGVIGITCKDSIGATVTAGLLYAFGGFVALIARGTYTDLIIWSILSIAFALTYWLTCIFEKEE